MPCCLTAGPNESNACPSPSPDAAPCCPKLGMLRCWLMLLGAMAPKLVLPIRKALLAAARARGGRPRRMGTEVGAPRAVHPRSGAPGAASSSQPPIDEDAPGARTKALIGPFPKAKVSATHDSRSKQARFVQERPEVYGRRLTTCVEPEAMDEEYVEVPSPLPSPRGEGFD